MKSIISKIIIFIFTSKLSIDFINVGKIKYITGYSDSGKTFKNSLKNSIIFIFKL